MKGFDEKNSDILVGAMVLNVGLKRISLNAKKSPLHIQRVAIHRDHDAGLQYLTPNQATKALYRLAKDPSSSQLSRDRIQFTIKTFDFYKRSLNPETVSRAAWSLVSLGCSRELLLSLPILEMVPQMNAKSLTRLVHKLHRVIPQDDSRVWEPVIDAVLNRIDEMTPVELVTCCHSFAKAGISTPELYRILTDRLVSDTPISPTWDISTWHPRQVSLLLWCLSTSACTNWQLMKLLTGIIPNLDLCPTDVACILSGLARANLVCEEKTLAAIPILQICSTQKPTLHTLCTTLHSIARLASLDDRLLMDHRLSGELFPSSMSSWLTGDVVRFLVDEIATYRSQLTFRALSMLTWSLSKLRLKADFVFDFVAQLEVPTTMTIEDRADLVAIVSSVASSGARKEISAIAHTLLQRTDWTDNEQSTLIHLLWSIGMMEGHSTILPPYETSVLQKLMRTTTERTDASMLFHYILMRGVDVDFPFGQKSWTLTNTQWTDDQSQSLEKVIVEWLGQLPEIHTVSQEAEITSGIFCDILLNNTIAIEVNGPSHYMFDLYTGEMSLDTKSIRRNEIVSNYVKQVVNISFLDYTDMLSLDKSSRNNRLRQFIS